MNDLSTAKVGDKVRFVEEKQAYTIQARGPRYLICTKPFNPKRTVLYTIVDLVQNIRGPENLIFGMGAETRQQCEEMVDRLDGRGKNGHEKWPTEISYRNRVPLKVRDVIEAKK